MTPFAVYILTDGLLLGLLVCWSPLATRAILGYPQPRALSDLPDQFQLLAENTADDQSFDLWIKRIEENTPLAVTVVPDSRLRSVLRSAVQKLGQGVPVFISRH